MLITLIIKKIYFDQILNGTKRYEYRQASPYYNELFAKKPTRIKLHYQGGEHLTADIVSIDLVDKPIEFANSPFLPTDKVYRLELKNVEAGFVRPSY